MRHNDRSKPPVTAEPQFEEFPDELRALKQWVMWRYVWKDEQKVWAKLPLQPNGEAASTTDPATWSNFDSVVLAFNQRVGYFSGIGFVFTRESGYVGVDIDNAVEWTEIDGVKCPVFGDWIKRTIAKIGETYVEYSPSRTGVHLIVKANPKQAVKFTEGGFEIYAEGRYFTMTGDAIENAPIADATEAIDEIVDALLGTRSQSAATETTKKDIPISYLSIEERLDIACNHASNSAAIKKLFDGDFSDYKNGENEGRSEADMALCRYLAFYSEGNPTLLMEMMRASKMPRPKWEKHYGDGSTYLSRLVKQVLSTERNFIEPAKSFLNAGKPATTGSNDRNSRKYRMMEMGEAALRERHDPNGRGLQVGGAFSEMDQYFRPKRKLMTIIVGDPGTGKTTLFINYTYHLAMAHKLKAGYASFENDPIDLTHSLVQAHLRRPTFPEFDNCCTDEEFLQALDEIGEFFTFWSPSWEESNVQALSEYWDDAIKSDGLDILMLDPFSNLQRGTPKPMERLSGQYTDFVREQLGYYRSFVQSRSLLSFLLCHPTKNFDRSRPPRLNDINGSGDFFRAADYGIGVARPDKMVVEIQKIRKWRTGDEGEVAFYYDVMRNVYTPTRPNTKKDRRIAF